MLSRNNALTEVSLRGNHFDITAGTALVNVFKHSQSLIELGLTEHEIGLDLYSEFHTIYGNKKAFAVPEGMPNDTVVRNDFIPFLWQYKE